MTEPEKQETDVELVVPPGYREGGRLDAYITRFLLNASRNKVQAGIKAGRVRINDEVILKTSHPVTAGDRIVCTILKPPPMRIEPEAIPLDIIYEDEHLIVVNKPPGMVVHPAYGNRTGTLVHALLHHVGAPAIDLESAEEESSEDKSRDAESPGNEAPDGEPSERQVERLSQVNAEPRYIGDIGVRPGIVHRLDKDTSGLLVVAKNDGAHTNLAKQFMARTTRRRYVAILWGLLDPEEGRIETDLSRDTRDRKRVAVVAEGKGKRAITNFKMLEHFQYACLAEFRLETGRTHQIRIHARHIGHPVVNDRTYGGDRLLKGPDTARRRAYWRNLFAAMPRQALHARSLGFRHPISGEDMDFECPIPGDMRSAITRLRAGDPGS